MRPCLDVGHSLDGFREFIATEITPQYATVVFSGVLEPASGAAWEVKEIGFEIVVLKLFKVLAAAEPERDGVIDVEGSGCAQRQFEAVKAVEVEVGRGTITTHSFAGGQGRWR